MKRRETEKEKEDRILSDPDLSDQEKMCYIYDNCKICPLGMVDPRYDYSEKYICKESVVIQNMIKTGKL